MKTVGNKIAKVTANKSKKHFTIIKEDGTKYRTTQMSRREFEDESNNTLNDWEQFLKSGDYYKVN